MITTAAQKTSLGFGFGQVLELHLLLIGDKKWFSLDRGGQHRLPFRSLTAQIAFFDLDDFDYKRASLTLFDGRSSICFASSMVATQIYQAVAMAGAKAGDTIEIALDAAGIPLVQKV
jgi:hypothetical protein